MLNLAKGTNANKEEDDRDNAIDIKFAVADTIEELNKEGVGGDSDDEDGVFVNDIHIALAKSSRLRLESLQFDKSVVLEEGNELEVETSKK